MKKYIVKYKESGKVFGEYNSRKEASDILMEYIYYFNDCSDGNYISPFDCTIEEVETSIEDFISDFESAKRYLNLKGSNAKNIAALSALDQLFTIAEAWNKEDGFVPDFSDLNQNKWYPWFKYDKDAAVFVCADTYNAPTAAGPSIGCRLCFKTRERAEQFGKQFEELYNKVFI